MHGRGHDARDLCDSLGTRLDRGGNRQINATIHRIAVTRLRCHPETRDYIARKRAEGKSTKEAIRCLKRLTSHAASGMVCSARARRRAMRGPQSP